MSRQPALEFYEWHASPVHRIAPVVKLLAAILGTISVAFLPAAFHSIGLLFYAALLITILLISRIAVWKFCTRLLGLELFAVSLSTLALVQPDGLHRFILLLTKSTLSAATMLLLTSTTPFAGLLQAMRQLRLPKILTTILALTYRYLFLLIEESRRMNDARASRTFTKRRRQRWQSLATVIAQLFLRSSLRAERVYQAMIARGWQL
ncbi:MAG: energy-coupling factor transporter transmembrane protein EcfT [bacterium]|nr:energy-coupling factor transporter transmembrane protein EcfT [bacterium]